MAKLELASGGGGEEHDTRSGGSHCGWHGIVFARTRASVIALHGLLVSKGELKRVKVVPFMGGGNKSASKRHRGMSKRQQNAAIEQFTAAEFGLLLATAAGKQGLDFPNCEFVVRWATRRRSVACWRTCTCCLSALLWYSPTCSSS
jgi:superfamily II DNA/RNA helicase